MEKLVSVWYKDQQSLPEKYIFPPETRPGNSIIPQSATIPVIDLSKASDQNPSDTIQKILEASKEFGFFQVINHGVSEKLINDTMDVLKEFFEMPAEDMLKLCSENSNKGFKLVSSGRNYDSEDNHLWRDSLRHSCHPLEECIQHWPEKPIRYREVIGAYSTEARKLGSNILELIAEGLGLESGYFNNQLSENLFMAINHYPPCPDPSLTLGLVKHCDHNLITILLQGDVSGLQVLKDGEWIGVEPLPNALVINIGFVLEIVSNSKLKSVEHRAVTNSKEVRTTAALFITPSDDCMVEPEKALTDASNPPLYRAFEYNEFVTNYRSIGFHDNRESILEFYKKNRQA